MMGQFEKAGDDSDRGLALPKKKNESRTVCSQKRLSSAVGLCGYTAQETAELGRRAELRHRIEPLERGRERVRKAP